MPVTVVNPWPTRARGILAAGQAVAHSLVTHGERPPREWPAWAKSLRDQKQDGETGVGDTVFRILGQTGETFKEYFKRATGKDCGCTIRQANLNREFPYVP